LLSVRLVLVSLRTGVTRYAALWCPDFPISLKKSTSRTCHGKYRIKKLKIKKPPVNLKSTRGKN